MDKKDKSPHYFMYAIFFITLAGGVLAVWFYWDTFCTIKDCHVRVDVEEWGQTGDFFGGVLNPFFTLVGLFFVIVTIQQNQQALKQNEIELQLSRDELKKSSEALQSQVVTAEKQRFETTFFQLLSLFNGVVKDLSFNNVKGRELVVQMYGTLQHYIRTNNASDIASINAAYEAFYNGSGGNMLASYFRTLYSLIKFVDNSEISDKDKKFYSHLVCTQLSKYELGLVFYNCLLYQNNLLLPLVKKYNLLEHLEDSALADPAHRTLLDEPSNLNN